MRNQWTLRRLILLIAGAIFGYYLISQTAFLAILYKGFSPLLLAFVLAYLLDNVVRMLMRLLRLPHPLAILATVVLIIVLIILVILRNSDLGRRADDASPFGYADYAGDSSRRDTDSGTGTGVGAWSVWGPVAVVGIAFTWTVVLLGGLAYKQVWVISRYVSPLGPVLILAMSVMAEWLMSSPEVRERTRFIGRQIIYFAGAGTILFNAWVFTAEVVPHARAFTRGVQECYFDMGVRLAATTPPDAVVAALDIGAVTFASDREVVDLMGLVSPEIMELGREVGFQAMVEGGDIVADLPHVIQRHAGFLIQLEQQQIGQ